MQMESVTCLTELSTRRRTRTDVMPSLLSSFSQHNRLLSWYDGRGSELQPLECRETPHGGGGEKGLEGLHICCWRIIFYGIWHSENPSEVSPCRSKHLYLEELLDKFPVDNGALDILSWAWMGIVRYSSSDSRRARCVLCTVCLQ